MATQQELKIKVTAQDNASSVLGRIAGRLDNFARSADRSFGEERGLRKMIRGGMIGFGAQHLASAAGGIRDAVTSVRMGEQSIGGAMEGIAGQLPFGIGAGWQGGRAIREIITGEEAAAQKLTQELERQNKARQLAYDLASKTAERQRQTLDYVKSAEARAMIAGATDKDRGRVALEQQQILERRALEKWRKDEDAKIKENFASRTEALSKQNMKAYEREEIVGKLTLERDAALAELKKDYGSRAQALGAAQSRETGLQRKQDSQRDIEDYRKEQDKNRQTDYDLWAFGQKMQGEKKNAISALLAPLTAMDWFRGGKAKGGGGPSFAADMVGGAESRLLTGRQNPMQRPVQETAKNTEKLTDMAQKQIDKLSELVSKFDAGALWQGIKLLPFP